VIHLFVKKSYCSSSTPFPNGVIHIRFMQGAEKYSLFLKIGWLGKKLSDTETCNGGTKTRQRKVFPYLSSCLRFWPLKNIEISS
jgi:hypothetical protein